MAKTKYERKNFLINKEIQFAYMTSFFVPMTVMLIIVAALFIFVLRMGVTSSTERVITDVNNNLTVFGDPADRTIRDYQIAIENTRQTLRTNHSEVNIERNLDLFIGSIMYILIPGFLLVILQIVLLTVFFSHKIAGPVFRLELACKRIINGDYSERVNLRDGDKMKSLSILFNEMTMATQERLETALNLESEEEKQEFRAKNKINP